MIAARGDLAAFGTGAQGPERRRAAGSGRDAGGGAGVLARVNVYELMFHPMGPPSFTAAHEAKLDKDEKVIAVQVGGQARAYPIRGMSYHHIVNDVVGGVAIVATY